MHLPEPQSAQIRKSSIDHEFLQDSPELCTGVRTATLHLHQRRGRRDADRPSDRHAHRRERRRTGAARPLDAGDRRIGLPAAHGRRPPVRDGSDRPLRTDDTHDDALPRHRQRQGARPHLPPRDAGNPLRRTAHFAAGGTAHRRRYTAARNARPSSRRPATASRRSARTASRPRASPSSGSRRRSSPTRRRSTCT